MTNRIVCVVFELIANSCSCKSGSKAGLSCCFLKYLICSVDVARAKKHIVSSFYLMLFAPPLVVIYE